MSQLEDDKARQHDQRNQMEEAYAKALKSKDEKIELLENQKAVMRRWFKLEPLPDLPPGSSEGRESPS